MQRSHIFLFGVLIVALTIISVVIGVIKLTNSQPVEKRNTETSGYASFSGTTNVFESLGRESEIAPSTLTTNPIPSEAIDQLSAIQHSINMTDQENLGRAKPQTKAEPKTPEQIEREEITSLFKDLIGEKVTDKFSQSGNSSVQENTEIWLGGYNGSSTYEQPSNESEAQAALHQYGNELGALLKSFNLSQGDQPNVLDKFIKDRANTTGLKRLTDGYIKLSADIAHITAPASLATIHSSLVSSYASVGELLWDLTSATNDEELMQKMLTYNESSNEVAKQQIAFITLLKAYDVTFKSHEAGSIFMFSPSASGGL